MKSHLLRAVSYSSWNLYLLFCGVKKNVCLRVINMCILKWYNICLDPSIVYKFTFEYMTLVFRFAILTKFEFGQNFFMYLYNLIF